MSYKALSLMFCALFVMHFFLVGQSNKQGVDIFLGGQYGGPIPSKMKDSTSGNALFSPKIGYRFFCHLSKKIAISSGFSFSKKGASYEQSLKKDTIVDIGFGVIPTFYTATVKGKMELWYLDMPINLGFVLSNKQWVGIGFNTSFLISGFDKGVVDVNVGYGGFADFSEKFNNYSNIQKIDFGANFMYKYQFLKQFFASIEVYRSFVGLYKNQKDNLYHTHASLTFGFSF